MKLFVLLVLAGGSGALAGSIAGSAFGRIPLFAGALLGGVIACPLAALLARRLGWLPTGDVTPTAIGAAIGFLAAAAIAVATISSPVGPVLSTLLVGAGGLAGRRLARRLAP